MAEILFMLGIYIWLFFNHSLGSLNGKESACNAGDLGSIPGLERIPWRRAWQPSPVFLPGESYGQRNLAGYSPWVYKESDTTERLTHTHRRTKYITSRVTRRLIYVS